MISIITPVLNEEENIEPFLSHHRTLVGDFEIILVDGGSKDRTVAEAKRRMGGWGRNIKLLVSEKGRAVQMNCGAAVAKGDILLFLHVDCRIPPDSLAIIEREISRNGVIGGAFRHSFESRDLLLRAESLFWNNIGRFTSLYLGDFGIFMQRDVFVALGGYDPLPFLEDYELCRKARERGRLVQVDREIAVSPRRYLQKGKYILTLAYILAVLFNVTGVRPSFLIRYVADR